MSIQVIIDRVSTFNYGFIDITGGEPLLQVETPILIHDLLDKKHPLTPLSSSLLLPHPIYQDFKLTSD